MSEIEKGRRRFGLILNKLLISPQLQPLPTLWRYCRLISLQTKPLNFRYKFAVTRAPKKTQNAKWRDRDYDVAWIYRSENTSHRELRELVSARSRTWAEIKTPLMLCFRSVIKIFSWGKGRAAGSNLYFHFFWWTINTSILISYIFPCFDNAGRKFCAWLIKKYNRFLILALYAYYAGKMTRVIGNKRAPARTHIHTHTRSVEIIFIWKA